MTRDELVEIVESRLGLRTGLNSRVGAEVKMAQRTLEAGTVLPWFLKKCIDITVPPVPVVKPTGFIREPEDAPGLRLNIDGKLVPMKKDDYDFLIRREDLYPGTGVPLFYAWNARGYHLFPTPAIAYTGEFEAYYHDDTLTSGGAENAWSTELPEILIAQAGLAMAFTLRSVESVALFKDSLAEAHKKMGEMNQAHDVAGRTLVIGG